MGTIYLNGIRYGGGGNGSQSLDLKLIAKVRNSSSYEIVDSDYIEYYSGWHDGVNFTLKNTDEYDIVAFINSSSARVSINTALSQNWEYATDYTFIERDSDDYFFWRALSITDKEYLQIADYNTSQTVCVNIYAVPKGKRFISFNISS